MTTVDRRRTTVRRTSVILTGLLIAYIPSWLPPVFRWAGIELPAVAAGPAASIVWNVAAVAGLVTYILTVERRSLESIGLRRPSGKDLEWALILFGCHMGFTWLARTIWPPDVDDGSVQIASMPLFAVILLILSAAVFEEILHRGYPLERLTELTGRRWLAVALTAPVFVVPHLVFFGPSWLLYQGSGTLVLYVLFLWRRNLVACMALHLLINLPILFVVGAGG